MLSEDEIPLKPQRKASEESTKNTVFFFGIFTIDKLDEMF